MDKTDPVSILCGVLRDNNIHIGEKDMHRLLNSVGLRLTSTQRLLVDDHLSRVRGLGGHSPINPVNSADQTKPPGHG